MLKRKRAGRPGTPVQSPPYLHPAINSGGLASKVFKTRAGLADDQKDDLPARACDTKTRISLQPCVRWGIV